LLRAEDIHADLVADTRHMWVSTPLGETMNPLGTPIIRNEGNRTQIDWAKLIDLGPPAFGISVFPLVREFIILLAACEAAIALAVLLSLFFNFGSVDVDAIRQMKR